MMAAVRGPASEFELRRTTSRGRTLAVWVCEGYDLALLETKADLPSSELLVLDRLPPLGTKVTAYGFPLGNEFGVSLTATGGQITRLPASAGTVLQSEDQETKDVRESLWHDATTSGGSSGGPLFNDHGVLIGLHFASLKKEHGIAVPSAAVAQFIRQSKLPSRVKFVRPEALQTAQLGYEPDKVTVYVEVLGTGSTSTHRR